MLIALTLLIIQPLGLTQLIIGAIHRVKLGTDLNTDIINSVSTLLYFLVFQYPLYCIITMDRMSEVISYKRMKLLLILFASVHL